MCKHSPGIQNILGFVQKAMTQCLLYRDMDEINTEEGEKVRQNIIQQITLTSDNTVTTEN